MTQQQIHRQVIQAIRALTAATKAIERQANSVNLFMLFPPSLTMSTYGQAKIPRVTRKLHKLIR